MSEQELREYISSNQLTEVDWYWISRYQKLSESFIHEHKDLVGGWYISIYQKLSESFIEEHKDLVKWDLISQYQKLSESFIHKHKDLVDWYCISQCQRLSEAFIDEYKDLVKWDLISIYQKLSESFVHEHNGLVNWRCISRYQKLSDKHNLKISPNNWMYVDPDERLKAIKKSGLYEIEGDYVLAFKGIRSDRYSAYNFQYQYFVGETYESHADFNIYEENSFGLSAWTLEGARNYCDQLIIKVKIHKSDLAALVHNGNKIRCTKFTVLEEVD
jgi:hypothetical protein